MPTLKDVAKKAGVSYGTVSEVLNLGKADRYSKETVKKVIESAKALNYQPHYFAQSLKKQKTKVIGVTTGGSNFLKVFNNPYVGDLFTGMGNYLGRTKYKLLFHHFQIDIDWQEILDFASSRMVDGILIFLYSRYIDSPESRRTIDQFSRLGIPYVMVHSLRRQMPGPGIGVDCIKGTEMAVEHLLQHGYQSVGLVTVKEPAGHLVEMEEGFVKALERYGHPGDKKYIYRAENVGTDNGYSFAGDLLKSNDRPRSLFIVDDSIAFGMLAKFREAKFGVPEELALIGFGDEIPQGYCPTELTSVKQPAVEKGYKACEMLVDLIDHPGKINKTKSLIIEPQLTLRKSCGCQKQGIIH